MIDRQREREKGFNWNRIESYWKLNSYRLSARFRFGFGLAPEHLEVFACKKDAFLHCFKKIEGASASKLASTGSGWFLVDVIKLSVARGRGAGRAGGAPSEIIH